MAVLTHVKSALLYITEDKKRVFTVYGMHPDLYKKADNSYK